MKKKFATTILSLAIGLTCCFNQTMVSKAAMNITGFEALSGATGMGAAKISWDKNGDHVYKVYKSTDGNNYETVGINFEEIKSVKVLNIYPTGGANKLKSWMENQGYGKGIIHVDEVYAGNFNSNPNGYLKDSNGNYKYDVIVFGFWDMNASQGIPTKVVEEYIKSGRGIILGHDTIADRGSSYIFDYRQSYIDLQDYFGIQTIMQNGKAYNGVSAQGSGYVSTAYIEKKGLFTTYPWNIGEVGTRLNIPTCHTSGQIAYGDVWLSLGSRTYKASDGIGIANPYLTTKGNCAQIQTGHSNGAATTDEMKILANLIFYLVQLHSNSPVTDNSAMDYAAPNIPQITIKSETKNNINFSISSKDNGTQYYYKVEEFDKSDTTKVLSSAKTSGRITTGLKGYVYTVDSNANTNVNKNNTFTNGNIVINRTNKTQYLHVAAIDNAGNVSATNHYKVLANDITAPIVSSVDERTLNVTAYDDESKSSTELVSGIAGYCVTNTIVKPSADKFTPNANLKANHSGYNYIWAIDNAGNISNPYKVRVHSDLYYNGVEIDHVFFNGVEVDSYFFENNKIFF